MNYWCDNCDDEAFGAKCQRCGHPARNVTPEATGRRPIPAPSTISLRRETAAALAETAPVRTPRFQTPPAEWFRRIRETIANTKP